MNTAIAASPLFRSASLPLPSTSGKGREGTAACDEVDGGRRELARETIWTAWASAVERCLRAPGGVLPRFADRALKEATAFAGAVDIEALDPLTLLSLREGLVDSLGRGLPGTLAVVSSADVEHRSYQHAFEAGAWCRVQEAAGVGLQEMATVEDLPLVLDPVSRQPITYLELLLWDRQRQTFQLLFDRHHTPVASAGAQVARAVMDVVVRPDAPARWAALGLTLSSSPVPFFPAPPEVPPPRDTAAFLLVGAAKCGDVETTQRCTSVWQPAELQETAALWRSWVERQPRLSEDEDRSAVDIGGAPEGEGPFPALVDARRAFELSALAEATCRALGARPRLFGAR